MRTADTPGGAVHEVFTKRQIHDQVECQRHHPDVDQLEQEVDRRGFGAEQDLRRVV